MQRKQEIGKEEWHEGREGVRVFGFWGRIYWNWDCHNAAETRTGGGLNAIRRKGAVAGGRECDRGRTMVEGVCDMQSPACVAPRRHSWEGGVCVGRAGDDV